jgi:hypothetical protein
VVRASAFIFWLAGLGAAVAGVILVTRGEGPAGGAAELCPSQPNSPVAIKPARSAFAKCIVAVLSLLVLARRLAMKMTRRTDG